VPLNQIGSSVPTIAIQTTSFNPRDLEGGATEARVTRECKSYSATHELRVERGAYPELAELVAGLATGRVEAIGDAGSGATVVVVPGRVVDRVGRALGRHELHGLHGRLSEAGDDTEVLQRGVGVRCKRAINPFSPSPKALEAPMAPHGMHDHCNEVGTRALHCESRLAPIAAQGGKASI